MKIFSRRFTLTTVVTVFCFICSLNIFNVFAQEQVLDLSSLDKDYIEKYGQKIIDEVGNEIIEIPISIIGDETIDRISSIDDSNDESDDLEIHEEHLPTIPRTFLAKHFSLTPHSHKVTNLSSYTMSDFAPLTSWAAPGFTVTKDYNQSVTVSAELSLSGGISKNDVEGELGVTVGGAYTVGSGESYSTVVPSGYKGRICVRYNMKVYNFVNKTTYVNNMPYSTWTTYDNCRAQGRPTNQTLYLQLMSY